MLYSAVITTKLDAGMAQPRLEGAREPSVALDDLVVSTRAISVIADVFGIE